VFIMSRILLRCKWPIELIVVLLARPIIDRPVPRLRPCRELQKSPLFVRWRHSGIFRASGCMIKFYTAYCASSHHESILCNFGINLHFLMLYLTAAKLGLLIAHAPSNTVIKSQNA